MPMILIDEINDVIPVPYWATYIAMDKDGTWVAFNQKPILYTDITGHVYWELDKNDQIPSHAWWESVHETRHLVDCINYKKSLRKVTKHVVTHHEDIVSVKLPMTGLVVQVLKNHTHIVMTEKGEWESYKNKPIVLGGASILFHGNGNWGVEYETEYDDNDNVVNHFCGSLAYTPELLNILNWEQSLFTVEELLCQP